MKLRLTNITTVCLYVFIFFTGLFVDINPYRLIVLLVFLEILRQIRNKIFFTSYVFWNLGFILLICTINIFSKDIVVEKLSIDVYSQTSKVFFLSFITIAFFYKYFTRNVVINYYSIPKTYKVNLFFFLFIIATYLVYMIFNGTRAIEIFKSGRGAFIVNSSFGGKGDQGLNRSIFTTVIYYFTEITGYLIPALIFLFFKIKTKIFKALLFTIIFSIPFWTIQFILGTRHHILFSFLSLVGSFIVLYPKIIRVKVKHFILLIFLGLIFSTAMMHIRKVGFSDVFNFSEFSFEPARISADPSGLYMNYVVDYYNKNEFNYGKSTSGLLFVLVPRSIWNNKPKGFNHWFYREHIIPGYKGYNSVTCSYLAIPFADFGLFGVILISIILAYFFARIDLYLSKHKNIRSFKNVITIAFLFTLSFYLPRGLTAVYLKIILSLSLIYLMSIINKLVIRKKNELLN